MGIVALRYVEEDNERRREIAAWYDEGLAGETAVERVPMAEGCVPSRHLYQVMVDRRDDVMLRLNAAAIYPGVHYRDNTAYRMYAASANTCPRAHRASDRIISLPMHLRLGRPEVARVAGALREAVRAT
jgi:dTDP-4-amino-4,6-dideoxygalactose transaminase